PGRGLAAAAQIDYGASVLRFAHAWACRHQRIVEALALDRDLRAIHPFADHFVLYACGPADGEPLVVAVGADRIGVASHKHAYKAVRLSRLDGFLDHSLRLCRQVEFIEVEEDDESLRRRWWRRWRRRRWRRCRRGRWRRRWRCSPQIIANAE